MPSEGHVYIRSAVEGDIGICSTCDETVTLVAVPDSPFERYWWINKNDDEICVNGETYHRVPAKNLILSET